MKRIILLLFCFVISSNYADVMYEVETRTTGITGFEEGGALIRNFIKGDRMRTEVNAENPQLGKMENLTITRMDKGVVWIIDQQNRVFTEIPLDTGLAIDLPLEADSVQPEISIVKSDETKEILKVICEKYIVTMKTKSRDDSIEVLQTMWVGKNFPGYAEIVRFNRKAAFSIRELRIIGIDDSAVKQLAQRISKIEGFPLELEFNIKLKNQEYEFALKTVSVVKKISTVPISHKVFEIPEGYQPNNNNLRSN